MPKILGFQAISSRAVEQQVVVECQNLFSQLFASVVAAGGSEVVIRSAHTRYINGMQLLQITYDRALNELPSTT
jgi:hypothetical protein